MGFRGGFFHRFAEVTQHARVNGDQDNRAKRIFFLGARFERVLESARLSERYLRHLGDDLHDLFPTRTVLMRVRYLNSVCVFKRDDQDVRLRSSERRRYVDRAIEGVRSDSRQVDRAIGRTRTCVERHRAYGMLYRNRAIANFHVNELRSDNFRVANGRFSHLSLRRVTRFPDTFNCRPFSNINRYIRANEDDRPFERDMRRFHVRGDSNKGVIQICAGRLLVIFLVHSSVISDRLNNDANNDKRYGSER